MPKYRVELPDGRVFEVDAGGDQPAAAEEPSMLSKAGSALAGAFTSAPPVQISKALVEGAYDLVRHPIKNAPTLGAIAATAATGGGALPMIGAAGLGGAGGSFVRDLANAVMGGEAPSMAAGVLKAGAMEGAKQGALQAGGEALFRGAPAILKAKARDFYQGALKPTKAVAPTEAERKALIEIGLDRERIPVGSQKGLEKASEAIGSLNDAVDNIVKEAAASGKTVDPAIVANRLASVRAKFGAQVNPDADLAAIERVRQEFLESVNAGMPFQAAGQTATAFDFVPTPSHPTPPTPRTIPVDRAQALKRGTYRTLGDKAYGEVGTASKEAQKALARGLKEEIATNVPEVSALNAREGELLKLKDALDDAMRRTGNREAVGLNEMLAMTRRPSLLPLAAFSRPSIMSRAAIGMNRTGGTLEQIDPEVMANLVRLALMSRLGDQPEP